MFPCLLRICKKLYAHFLQPSNDFSFLSFFSITLLKCFKPLKKNNQHFRMYDSKCGCECIFRNCAHYINHLYIICMLHIIDCCVVHIYYTDKTIILLYDIISK